jgi:hypothetical protein
MLQGWRNPAPQSRHQRAFANAIPFQLLKSASGNHPVVQILTAQSERVVDILIGPGAVAVQRYRETMHTKLGHSVILFWVKSMRRQVLHTKKVTAATTVAISHLYKNLIRLSL